MHPIIIRLWKTLLLSILFAGVLGLLCFGGWVALYGLQKLTGSTDLFMALPLTGIVVAAWCASAPN